MTTYARLREVLHYDTETGVFTWLKSGSGRRPDLTAGRQHSEGYIHIGIDGRRYYAHRLAWLYMTGAFPKEQIDHKNADRSDNRWSNLREATQFQNNANARRSKRNKSGFKGVSWAKKHKKWTAHISVEGRQINLGLFDDASVAHAAYVRMATAAHGAFARAD